MINKRKATGMTTRTNQGTVVPRRRFPEFRNAGEWEARSLGELSASVASKVGDEQLIPLSISAGIGFVRQSEKFGRDISGMQSSSYTVVTDGDFVYNKGNSLRFPQGCIYQLQGWGRAAVPFVFICFRLNAGEIPNFYAYCFEHNIHGKQLARHITSSVRSNGLLNISKDDFYSISIPHPCANEQQKIADCLSTLDEAISAVGRKLEALKTHKRGLMQQLFPRESETTPRLRFPEFRDAGDWNELKVKDVANYENGKAHEKHISEAGRFIVVNSRFISTDGIAKKYTSMDSCLAHTDDTLMVLSDLPNGRALAKCFFVDKDDLYAVNQRICRITPRNVAGKFLYLTLNRNRNLLSYNDGQNQTNLKEDHVLECTLNVPRAIKEQKKIADCLSTLDEAISAVSRKLETLKTYKKGLMQQLFPDMTQVNG